MCSGRVTPVNATSFFCADMLYGNAFDSSSAISAQEAGHVIVDSLQRGEDEIVCPEELKALAIQIGSMPPRERANTVIQLMEDNV